MGIRPRNCILIRHIKRLTFWVGLTISHFCCEMIAPTFIEILLQFIIIIINFLLLIYYCKRKGAPRQPGRFNAGLRPPAQGKVMAPENILIVWILAGADLTVINLIIQWKELLYSVDFKWSFISFTSYSEFKILTTNVSLWQAAELNLFYSLALSAQRSELLVFVGFLTRPVLSNRAKCCFIHEWTFSPPESVKGR